MNARAAPPVAVGMGTTQAKVTGGVGNATAEMTRARRAGEDATSTTAMPDSSACSVEPNEPPQATSTVAAPGA